MTCKEEKKTDTHDQSAQAFISTAELFLEEDAVWSKYLFNWSSGWVIPSLGHVPLVPNVITRFLYVFCWEMWMSDGSVGAFLWKISVQSHTYTSLHVLIVILRVSLDDRWHFFLFWRCTKYCIFEIATEAALCTALRQAAVRDLVHLWCENMFVPAYAMAKVKYTNSAAVHEHTTRRPHRRRSSAPPQCFFSLPRISTVQIFSCLTLNGTRPSAAAHKLWMAVDRPGSRLPWRWVICTLPTGSSAAGCGRVHATIQ